MKRNTGGRPRLPEGKRRKERRVCIEDDLWLPYVALVGLGNASADIRQYLAERIANEERAA